MVKIRRCGVDDQAAVLSIINAAAAAYRDVIPADRWHDPYMPAHELDDEIAAGVDFWGYETDGRLVGVMGIQPVLDVHLIRHAYVEPGRQRLGVGSSLVSHLRPLSTAACLSGHGLPPIGRFASTNATASTCSTPSAAPRCSAGIGPSRTARSRHP